MSVPFDPQIDALPPRFVVGVDLGTTNSAVTFIDTDAQPWRIEVFLMSQPVSATEVERLDTLPSFYFQPLAGTADFNFCVGAYARDETLKTSGRGIGSAKSWLCHPAVDRTAAILPWHGASDVQRLSPVEVSSAYLAHIRKCWDREHPEHPLADQDLVVTLPASFDEVARELTIEAARQAGLPRLMLIEEPQAAFYAWVYKHQTDWDTRVQIGQKILVCDIGGGTTDFTLIRVRRSESSQLQTSGQELAEAHADPRIQFHRVAVGNHLILGGDNLDLAIAKNLEHRVTPGGKLEPYQWDVLVGSSRQVKEQLLTPGGPDQFTVNLPGRGSKLIGSSLQIEVTRAEIQELILSGFLPEVELEAKPRLMQSGFQELGLPYASDPAITRYLAAFLTTHTYAGMETAGEAAVAGATKSESASELQRAARPDVILFNGGFFASPLLRERLVGQLQTWFRTLDDPAWQLKVLDNDRLDLAVARGAAYYGMVRRDQGVRIAATLARSYYLALGGEPPQAICIMPGSAEPGKTFLLPERTFQLAVSQPVEFSLYVSSVRLADQPGMIIAIDPEQLSSLPPIRTVLKTKSRNERGEVPVRLQIGLTELGTIDLACQQVDSERSWRLQFDVRSTTQTDLAGHSGSGEAQGVYDETIWQECELKIESVFGRPPLAAGNPSGIVRELVEILGPREQWPMSLLRRIWGALLERETGRRRSQQHEARWLNLLGYSLRPGFGMALDDWRVTETWRQVHNKIVHQTPGVRNELLILWRRLAGGLNRGQQLMIAEPWLASLRLLARQLAGQGGKGNPASLRAEDSVEVWRLLGSLELLPLNYKQELGELAITIMHKPKFEKVRDTVIWAIGRLGQREPTYGPLNTVLSSDVSASWIEALLTARPTLMQQFTVALIARRTGDRYRDIGDLLRSKVLIWLTENQANAHLCELVRDGGKLAIEEQGQMFGESLPPGIRLESKLG